MAFWTSASWTLPQGGRPLYDVNPPECLSGGAPQCVCLGLGPQGGRCRGQAWLWEGQGMCSLGSCGAWVVCLWGGVSWGRCTQPLNHVHCVLKPGVERWYLQVFSPRVRARTHTGWGTQAGSCPPGHVSIDLRVCVSASVCVCVCPTVNADEAQPTPPSLQPGSLSSRVPVV